EWITSVVPRFHSTDEITGEFGETCANKQAHDFIEIIVIFQHQQKRLFRIQKGPSPDRKHGRTSDVQRSRNMRAAEAQHQTCVDKNACLFIDRFLECLWRYHGVSEHTLSAHKYEMSSGV